MENRFNLVDEPWVPVANAGRVSLRRLFTCQDYRSIGGNPVQKIALMKLLLAIVQAAYTPKDDTRRRELAVEEMAFRCLEHLEQWHDRFFLYGDRPFLQMPMIVKAAKQGYGAVLPDVATGNTTILGQLQVERPLDDADRALLLVSQMGFALGGKKTDNSVTLTPGYMGKRNEKGKPSTGKPGPSIAHLGLLHNMVLGQSIWQSLWLNLLTARQIEETGVFLQGVGIAPWVEMPKGEDCSVARRLKQSLMGRLVPLCRFCLLADDGLHYSEGLQHANYADGVVDPTVAVDYSNKKARALWVNPDKRPWRELTALLGFISQNKSSGWQCMQLNAGISRVQGMGDAFTVWSGGLRVSSNAGEQYVAGTDDFVESQVRLSPDILGSLEFAQLQAEMSALEDVAKGLYGCVSSFFRLQKVDGTMVARRATQAFWEICERRFEDLVDACEHSESTAEGLRVLRRLFAHNARSVYDQHCPRHTARQIDHWAQSRQNFSKYLATGV
jgi:CRISPR system Cascade subunit CasA